MCRPFFLTAIWDKPLEVMFDENVPYICLDAGTLACLDDIFSCIHFSWTGSSSINPDTRLGFNRITHGSTRKIVWSLYKSVTLSSTDKMVGLYSPNTLYQGSYGCT